LKSKIIIGLDGFRALACLWVVVLHVWALYPQDTLDDEEKILYSNISTSVPFNFVYNGSYGVDIFFILSGYLIMSILGKELAHHYTSQLFLFGANKKRKQTSTRQDPEKTALLTNEIVPNFYQERTKELPTTIPPLYSLAFLKSSLKFYIRRIFRILPSYSASLLIYYLLASNIAYKYSRIEVRICDDKIWTNFLFIQNFYSFICMSWSWSIAVEMQMYLISPLIVWLVLRFERFAHLTLIGFSLISMGSYIGLTYGHDANASEWMEYVYIRPYSRIFAYLIGMQVALVIAQQRLKAQRDIEDKEIEFREEEDQNQNFTTFQKVRDLLLRVLAILVFLFSTIICSADPTQVDDPTLFALNIFFGRFFFTFVIAYMMYDSLSDQVWKEPLHKISVWILSSHLLFWIAQVSYEMYLLHPTLLKNIYHGYKNIADEISFSIWVYFVFLLLIIIASFVFSCILYILVGKPFLNLSDLIFRKTSNFWKN